MNKCPKCNENVESGNFCPNCGTGLLKEVTCPRCDTMLSAKSKFCSQCGIEIQKDYNSGSRRILNIRSFNRERIRDIFRGFKYAIIIIVSLFIFGVVWANVATYLGLS